MNEDEADLTSLAATCFLPDRPTRAVVAVSGGGDSMSLLHIMARVAGQAGWILSAVTVDHGLRSESADEAAMVARVCRRLGVKHSTLHWRHDGKISGNLMAAARTARYGLIARWAVEQGITHVALAHTADDQAETLLIGLSRVSGLDGLTGMRLRWSQGGVVWARPLLGVTRAGLRRYLHEHKLSWVEDPSNQDIRFARIRARKALVALAPLGITALGLAKVAENLAGEQRTLGHILAAATKMVVHEVAGALRFDHAALTSMEAGLRRRLFLAALRWMGRGEYAPRAADLMRFEAAALIGRAATLAGCRLLMAKGILWMVRESVATENTTAMAIWDGRWQLTGPRDPADKIGMLGASGLAACKGWRDMGLPRAVLLVTPAIWRDGQLISAPLAGKFQGWQAKTAPSFNSFVMAH